MLSVTAQFLSAGFNHYLLTSADWNNVIHRTFAGNGELETAQRLSEIAESADKYMRSMAGELPGVWEYEIVNPYGNLLAKWAHEGRDVSLSQMMELLNVFTLSWIETGDVPAELSEQPRDEDADRRTKLIMITMTKNGERGIHFCQHPLLSGSNYNQWFPVAPGDSWFIAAERILTMNGIAENVTLVTPCNGSDTDFEVVFNRKAV